MTIISGRHMMKTGGQFLRQQMNTFYAGNNGRTGLMEFSGRWTGAESSQFGWGDADFFLDQPERIGRGLNTGTWGHRKSIFGFYFQDDWRVSNSLTVNLGLRWEYHTPLVEVADRQSNFEPFSGQLLVPPDKVSSIPGSKAANNRALYEPYKKDFQPRVGFAWTPVDRFVIRGAYTISSFMEGTGTNLRLPFNPPFNAEFEARYDNPNLSLPGSTASQGLTALQQVDPYSGVNIRLWDPFVRPANTQQWNLTIERQLPGQMVATAGYVGQKGAHLVVPMPYFQRQLLANGATAPSPYLSGNPQLSRIAQISGTESNGNQSYNALQATLRKRYSAGLEFQAAYTYSKGMSDAIGYYGEGGQAASQSAYWQYLYDRRAEWGPTYFDVTHSFTLSHFYELPIGKGKTVGDNMPGVLQYIVGNWQLGGILTLHTGFPLTIRGPRPYQIAQRGTLGSAGNGTERGPGLHQYDLSLQKQFPLTERVRLELRGEFLNLTNTPQFNAPSSTVNSATFGEVRGSQNERQAQLAMKLYF